MSLSTQNVQITCMNYELIILRVLRLSLPFLFSTPFPNPPLKNNKKISIENVKEYRLIKSFSR